MMPWIGLAFIVLGLLLGLCTPALAAGVRLVLLGSLTLLWYVSWWLGLAVLVWFLVWDKEAI